MQYIQVSKKPLTLCEFFFYILSGAILRIYEIHCINVMFLTLQLLHDDKTCTF
jgi:hypothetical protein